MQTREQIEQSFKELIVPTGRGDIQVQLELMLDIRDLLEELALSKRLETQIEEAKRARESSAKECINRSEGGE